MEYRNEQFSSPYTGLKQLLKTVDYSDYGFERCLQTATGGQKWIQWNVSKNIDGSIIGIGYDITARKIAEEQTKIANAELRKKHKEVLDSIEYAKHLQQTMLPRLDALKEIFANAFVFYKPKDIVTGDFYWMHLSPSPLSSRRGGGGEVLFAAADCTGHGVPGAMVSVVCQNALKEVVNKRKLTEPATILDAVNQIVVKSFSSAHYLVRDGMDIALCAYLPHPQGNGGVLKYAGANNPLWIINPKRTHWPENALPFGEGQGGAEIKPDKQSIGDAENEPFTQQEIEVQKGDMIFIFSDGYADQFGGENNKKLNKARFKEVVQFTAQLEDQEQEGYLQYIHQNWKQKEEQTDDILVMGIKI
jgi:serine phosphatase RsbU (regulator of sigma subunit)